MKNRAFHFEIKNLLTQFVAAFDDTVISRYNKDRERKSNIEVRYSDMFPVSLSGLNFNQQATDIDYLSASVTMKYKIYEFATKGGSRTTVTTS